MITSDEQEKRIELLETTILEILNKYWEITKDPYYKELASKIKEERDYITMLKNARKATNENDMRRMK